MTRTGMHSSLGIRLNDPNEDRFDATKKDLGLNDAQNQIVEVLPDDQLLELEKRKLDIDSGTGINTTTKRTKLTKTSTALFDPIALRFISGNYRHSTSGYEYWFDLLSTKDSWKRGNNLIYSNYKSAVINDTEIYFYIYPGKPSTCVIDINYIRMPKSISNSQDCELKVSLHVLVVECAAYILTKKPEQVELALQKYMKDLQEAKG